MSGFRIFAMLALFMAMTMAPRAEACSCEIYQGTRAEQVLVALNDDGAVFLTHPLKRP